MEQPGFRVLIAEPDRFSPQAVAVLERFATVDLRPCTRSELAEAFQTYDVVWVRLAERITADLMGEQPRCKVLACPVTGLDHIDLKACAERGIEVVSLKGETAFLREVRATSELAVGLALALMRRIPAASRSVEDGTWDRDRFPGCELYRKTAGIVGVGRLGSIVAEYFAAFGMRVIGYDPRPDFPEGLVERRLSLAALLEEADVVSLHVTYDETTRHLIDAERLSRMKPGAVLVNTSRGGVIEEEALLHALETGQLAGAALDVLDGEPNIDEEHPLVAYARTHEHLLIVPHIGGNTRESFEKTEVFLAERVLEVLQSTVIG